MMPTFNKSNQKFYYVHIPRTAGRYVYELIKSNGFEQNGNDDIVTSHYDRVSYENYLSVESIPHITVIRNPIDRFFGSSFLLKKTYGKNIDYILENTSDFFALLDNFWIGNSLKGTISVDPVENMIKYFKPLSDYISPDTKIWRYEDGFGKNFSYWMSDILNIDFKINDVSYPRLGTNESDKIDRNSRIIDNVIEYYKDDINKYYR